MLTPLGAMSIAISEAQKGLGFVAPNPPVGCVILDKNGDMLAKGYHRIYGGHHAEIDALKQITQPESLVGATVYVTLEPCAHQGRTPSCAKHLATLPIKKIVYGCVDPNPLVSGQGLKILSDAGIQVEKSSVLQVELQELAEVFLWNQVKKAPFVAVKVATSLDGQLAHVSGESRWISGEESREWAHYLRAIYDATLIGGGTFEKDNPQLNIRHPQFIGKKNKVVILDTRARLIKSFSDSNIFKTHDPDDVYIAVGKGYKYDGGYDYGHWIECDLDEEGKISWPSLLNLLYGSGITSVLVEGGARTTSSLLNSGFAQRYYQFIAPILIGAKSGISFTKEVHHTTLPERNELMHSRIKSFGRDIMITGRLDDFIR